MSDSINELVSRALCSDAQGDSAVYYYYYYYYYIVYSVKRFVDSIR